MKNRRLLHLGLVSILINPILLHVTIVLLVPPSLLLGVYGDTVVASVGPSSELLGCKVYPELCTDQETCIDDGISGVCRRPIRRLQDFVDEGGGEGGNVEDANVENKQPKYTLSPDEDELVRSVLTLLKSRGYALNGDRVQCELRYLSFVFRHHFAYDVKFCDIRKPADLIYLLEVVDDGESQNFEIIRKKSIIDTADNENSDLSNNDIIDSNNDIIDNNNDEYLKQDLPRFPATPILVASDDGGVDLEDIVDDLNSKDDQDSVVLSRKHRIRDTLASASPSDLPNISIKYNSNDRSLNDGPSSSYTLSENEENLLNHYIWQSMNGVEPDFSQLTNDQLARYLNYVEMLFSVLRDSDGVSEGEVVERRSVNDDDAEKFLFKKDEEKLGILDQGTGNKQHIIQTRYPNQVTPSPKDALLGLNDQKLRTVQGNRVYMRLNKNFTRMDMPFLERIADYLDEKIAKPNNLTFSDYRVNMNELSFNVDSVDELTPQRIREAFVLPLSASKTLTPRADASLVADQVYHLMKKAPTMVSSSAKVLETGIGSGQNSLSVHNSSAEGDDDFVLPTLIVCGLVIGTLALVLGLYMHRGRSRANATMKMLAADLEGKPSKDYQELCRQRMSGKTDDRLETLSQAGGGTGIVGTLAQRLGSQSEPSPPPYSSTRSSTSSWSEEPVQTNMDISTGHTILTYMEKHLIDKNMLEQEWQSLEKYEADLTATTVADQSVNQAKNRYADVIPYDHTRVVLSETSNQQNSDYINASFICDHDPRNPSYIATQGPLPETTADFWQMIWEQGSVVIVNLTKLTENGVVKCTRYWPENGSEVFHYYEVHLVSEHIWCTDYLVRSFYLKNLRTHETRTVTQFHFLTWPEDSSPASTKSLLDFRRKVNKSFRGRSCPIVLHCSDGSSRTGTYCLLDMVLNRINKGVKEIDIAATLEHLRDQRMKFVRSIDQFEFVLTCVAEEVQAILKALPQ